MKIQFKMPRSLDGVNYSKGIHEVPDSLSKHWYFLALVQNGDAVILESAKDKTSHEEVEEKTVELPAPTYQEHMAQWKSKEELGEKKTRKRTKKTEE